VLNAPRVLQPIDGDCELRVKVLTFPLPGEATAAGGGQSFVSTGLLLWQDDKNFVRFERAAMGGFEQPFVWLERFKDGKTAVEKFKLIADKETGLQIKREGSRFTFSYDEVGDKKAWTVFHAEEFDLPFKLRAGVVAVNSTIREFPARLTGFEIGGKK
jgi:hypothetical protein